MSGKVVWPVLGSEGWVEDPGRQLNVSFAHSLASDKIQSTVYGGNITSLMDTITKFHTDPERLMVEVQKQYTNFYNRIFDTAEVITRYEMLGTNEYTLIISIVVSRAGVNYALSYTGLLDNGSLRNTLLGMTKQ